MSNKDNTANSKDSGSNATQETKKQVPLRLNAKLWNELSAWAEDEFRSVNGQIEYLLTECVKNRKKNKNEE